MNNLTPSQLALIAVSPLFVLVMGALWSDIKRHRIPNRLVFCGAGLGLLLNSVLPQGYGFISLLPAALGPWKVLTGLGLGLAILLPLYMLRAMAAGDVKLMSMIGAFLGPTATRLSRVKIVVMARSTISYDLLFNKEGVCYECHQKFSAA